MPTSEIDLSHYDTGSLPKWSGSIQPYEYELYIGPIGYQLSDLGYYSFDRIQTNQLIFKLPENVVIADAPNVTPPADSAILYYYDPSGDELKYAFFHRQYTGSLPYRWTGKLSQGFATDIDGSDSSGILYWQNNYWYLDFYGNGYYDTIYATAAINGLDLNDERYPWELTTWEDGGLNLGSSYFKTNEILTTYTKINDNTIRVDTNLDSLPRPLNDLYIRLSGVN